MTSITPSSDSPVPSQVPDTLSPQYLQAMQMVAKMKESADKHGVGFVGGFVSPDGKKFMMTNMNEDDTQFLLPDDLKWQRNHQLTSTVLSQVSTSPSMVLSHIPSHLNLVPSNWHSMAVALVYKDLYPYQAQA